MINIYDYFAINWEATADNIKSLMSTRASNKVLANFMLVDERTIRNWYNGTSKPDDLDKFVLIAKICNVDLLDIFVLNGQISDCISKEDVEECIEKVEQTWDDKELKEKDKEFDYINEQMIIRGIVINEYRKQNYPITNLDEFLLMLPLVNMRKLWDMLYRINGNIGKENYVLEQLMKLYDNIPNDRAKEFVEYYKEYYLTYPSIKSVTDFTTMDFKLKKFEDGINIFESEEYGEMYKSYQEKYDTFLELLLLASGKKLIRE
jgi:transcriptional regulator with XRE-family HTH domain